jgi:hypothetical protein
VTPWLLEALAKHVAGSDTLVVSGDFYATLALAGTPVTGVTAQAFTYAEPVVLSDTEVM